MTKLIEARSVYKSFDNNDVLVDINIVIEKGDFISIMGKSGSGKSTLLNILIGQLKPTSGNIFIENFNVNEMKDREISSLRLNKLGFVNQDPLLFEEFNVLENIEMPLRIAGKLNRENRKLVYGYMEKLDIIDLKNKKIHELSGGQKQRVSIVRALSMKPQILIADEPTGNLDDESKMDFINLLRTIHKDFDLTTVIVTHDKTISSLCDKHYEIKDQSLTSIL